MAYENFKRRAFRYLAFALVVALPVVAVAFGGHGPHMGKDVGKHVQRMADDLDLSDAQRASVEQIMTDARAQSEPLREQMRSAREAMRGIVHADTFDEAAVRALAGQNAATMTELAVIRAKSRHAVHAVLTPEQREKMHSMRAARHEHRKHGGGRHGDGPCRGKGADGSKRQSG